MRLPTPGKYKTKSPSVNVCNNPSSEFTFTSLPNFKNKNSRYSIIIATDLSQTPRTPAMFLHPIWRSRYASFAQIFFYFFKNSWVLRFCDNNYSIVNTFLYDYKQTTSLKRTDFVLARKIQWSNAVLFSFGINF